jgi:hypothetical protein
MLAGRRYYVAAISLGIPFMPSMIEADLRHYFPLAGFIALMIGSAITTTITDTAILEKTYNGLVIVTISVLLFVNGHLHTELDVARSPLPRP